MKWKFQAPFQFLFKKADHIIGISERITEEYSNRTGLNLNFVPPLIPFSISDKSVAEAKLERGIEPNSKVILMVGSLKLLKHPETAVEALINLGIGFLESQNIQLVFAGDGPDRPSLESKIMEAGISQHVRFLGNVSREEIADVYRASDLYIMASEFEGTPLSMLEAMANGIPVLASNAPGIATIIEHQNNGLLFTIGNGNELAEAIKTLINNHELSTKLTHKARLTLETRYDHGKMLDFYRKIWSL